MRIKSHPLRDGFSYQMERAALDLGFKASDHVEETLVKAAIGGDGFLDGDVSDVRALEDGDAAPLALVHHINGVKAVTLAEQTVVRRGHTAALGVAEVHAAGFKAGLLLDELGERFSDPGELRVAEGIDLA